MIQKERGVIGILLLVIITLILLKYFLNWSVFDAATSDQGKSTILYIRDIFNLLWHYLAAPISFVWNQILLPIINISWKNFQQIIDLGKHAGQAPCCNSVY